MVSRSVSLPILSLIALVLTVPAARSAAPREIEDGVLDWLRIVGDAPAADAVVVVRSFDASGADLGTGADGGKAKRVEVAQRFQQDGPGILVDTTTAAIRERGPFTTVLEDEADAPADAIVVEGRFTRLDPGSKAKRYWAGFGAGKGVIEIEGRILDADGNVLAEFRQRRLTVMGVFGGDYEKKMRSDLENLGDDIAKFLERWVSGKSLDK